MTRPLGFAVAATAAALLAGCGSSSSSSNSKAASTPASTAAATSTQGTTASTSTAAAGSGVAVEAKHSKLGTILAAGSKRKTVYLFEADKGATSSCTGECAKHWPPVTSTGAPSAVAGAVSADLGTTMRSDGTTQVTYKGHPLYFYGDDKDAGDSYGQGSKEFGASWYVLKPDGSKLDKS